MKRFGLYRNRKMRECDFRIAFIEQVGNTYLRVTGCWVRRFGDPHNWVDTIIVQHKDQQDWSEIG